ncbi:MAG: type IV secretion system protein VirB3 [Janthinobacterium lividum]
MSERLEENTLYIAATRPALVAGVPLPVAGAFLMLAGFIIVFLKNPLFEVVMAPLWFGAKLLVSRDYNAVNVVMLWLQTAARSVDGSAWGGSSVSPNPIKVPPRGRGMI